MHERFHCEEAERNSDDPGVRRLRGKAGCEENVLNLKSRCVNGTEFFFYYCKRLTFFSSSTARYANA